MLLSRYPTRAPSKPTISEPLCKHHHHKTLIPKNSQFADHQRGNEQVWRPLYPLEVIKLDKIFLFKFQHETDSQKTLLKRSWSIHGGHLILKKWNPYLTWKEVDLSKSTLWI